MWYIYGSSGIYTIIYYSIYTMVHILCYKHLGTGILCGIYSEVRHSGIYTVEYTVRLDTVVYTVV